MRSSSRSVENLDLNSVIKQKSVLLMQARYQEALNKGEEAKKLYISVALNEEWIAEKLIEMGRGSEAAVNMLSAASCWKKADEKFKAVKLLKKLLSLQGTTSALREEAVVLQREWIDSMKVQPTVKIKNRKLHPKRSSRKTSTAFSKKDAISQQLEIPPRPTIILFFTGLQALFFDDEGASCRVGMLNQASHQLYVKVKVVHEGSVSVIDLSDAIKGYDLRLSVVNPKMSGVEIYKKGDFVRESPDNDPQDFRWVVGIRSEEFHGNTPIDHQAFRQSFYTDTGLFYTYRKTRAIIIRNKDKINRAVELAEYIGAAIDLQGADSEAILTFGMDGEQSLHLRKKPHTRYEIIIANDCPNYLGTDSDFQFYYNAFLVPEDDQFILTSPYNKDKSRSIIPAPCIPVCGQWPDV